MTLPYLSGLLINHSASRIIPRAQVFLGFLAFHDPPPAARRAIRVISIFASVFQASCALGAALCCFVLHCSRGVNPAFARAPAVFHVRPAAVACKITLPEHNYCNAFAPKSFLLQRLVLYSFPAICWAYGAGALFSSFVSVVFWTGCVSSGVAASQVGMWGYWLLRLDACKPGIWLLLAPFVLEATSFPAFCRPLVRTAERLRSAAVSVQPRQWHHGERCCSGGGAVGRCVAGMCATTDCGRCTQPRQWHHGERCCLAAVCVELH